LTTANYDNLRQFTTFYDNLRHSTTFYDILRHSTTNYDILRQPTAFYDKSTTFYDNLRHVYDILRLRHLRGFFETFASIRLLLLLSVVMDNIEDWLAQVHGILQGNADGFKGSLVFGNAMPEQSTESAVELLLTSALILAKSLLEYPCRGKTSMSNSVSDLAFGGKPPSTITFFPF
jgi:hypothetical protein